MTKQTAGRRTPGVRTYDRAGQVARLEERVVQLEQLVRRLERRVAQVEEQTEHVIEALEGTERWELHS